MGYFRVRGSAVELITRFRWRAERRAKKLNERKEFIFYHYEVQPYGKKWEVIVVQDKAKPSG